MTAVLLGDKKLTQQLQKLERRSSKKAIVAGIRAGMKPVAKAMRAAINASEASPELKREARKTIGARFGKTRRVQERHAKVGFSVGKRAAAIKRAVGARKERVAAGKSSGAGVGISAANIHWFVLGTDERQQKSGRATGRIANVFGDVTRIALAGSAHAVLAAARKKISQVIKREAAKRAG